MSDSSPRGNSYQKDACLPGEHPFFARLASKGEHEMENAPCPMRGLINDLARTLMATMVHFDNLLLQLDHDSEGFGEAWLANQQLQRALEFFFELRSECMSCHKNEFTSRHKKDHYKLTTLDKTLHKYNNVIEFIFGYFELIQNISINIKNINQNTKRIIKIVQETKYPSYHHSSNNKSNMNYGDIKLLNKDHHNKTDNKTILLVDDDEGVKQVLATVLRQHKYSVVECSNGETALTNFEQAKSNFILCIIDIGLPDIEGPILAKKLLLINPNINVLYISGYPEIKLKKQFPSIDQHQIMTKPFHLVDLVNKIRAITLN
ncbi:MAG: response regulator [Syntrophobacterales bacterium]|nr:response regulator [Syntrophobacterales bacterium]